MKGHNRLSRTYRLCIYSTYQLRLSLRHAPSEQTSPPSPCLSPVTIINRRDTIVLSHICYYKQIEGQGRWLETQDCYVSSQLEQSTQNVKVLLNWVYRCGFLISHAITNIQTTCTCVCTYMYHVPPNTAQCSHKWVSETWGLLNSNYAMFTYKFTCDGVSFDCISFDCVVLSVNGGPISFISEQSYQSHSWKRQHQWCKREAAIYSWPPLHIHTNTHTYSGIPEGVGTIDTNITTVQKLDMNNYHLTLNFDCHLLAKT